jgi:hypothetical protein
MLLYLVARLDSLIRSTDVIGGLEQLPYINLRLMHPK